MRRYFARWLKSISLEVINYPRVYLLLFLILVLAFFVRVYRIEDLLGFYYDQGRDALVIWRLWHEGKFFLIGPVTGLSGIFLGPLYYYIIAPIYLLSAGSPILPAVFLAFTATVASFLLYYLGWKFHSRPTGIIAATIGAFSYFIVLAGRWLSNPTLILLSSMLLLLSMWKVVSYERRATGPKGLGPGGWWIAIALFVGVSLQFESASAVFYIPMIVVFAGWLGLRRMFLREKGFLPNKKIFLISLAVFLATLLPQILFNFRHDNLLIDNFKRVIVDDQSFRLPLKADTKFRLEYFWGVYHSKIFPGWQIYAILFSVLSASVILASWKSFSKNKGVQLLLIFLGVPMLLYLTFYGNFGNIYDYYMSGYYLPMILLFSLGLGELWKGKGGKLVVLFFFALFLLQNGSLNKNYLTATVLSRPIALEDQLQAVDWVFDDASGRGDFNVDVYVPPVIPHAYDYLFLWQANLRHASAVSSAESVQGKQGCERELCGMILDEQITLLYILYEADPPHPERLEAWLDKYIGSTVVEDEARFGSITVQRRQRL